jgi:hypothetical protein
MMNLLYSDRIGVMGFCEQEGKTFESFFFILQLKYLEGQKQ